MTGSSYDDIVEIVKKDLLGCDIALSFLIAASLSYRHDTVLRPFPQAFTRNDGQEKCYKDLENVLKRLPAFTDLNIIQNDSEAIGIIYWCLKNGKFTLSSCPTEKFSLIAALTGHSGSVPTPTHIFEVKYSKSADEKFLERRGERDVFFAYHGSRVENFHCILHLGLQGHMNKNSLFGEGTYLSSELSVSMPYAPAGSGWKASAVGEKMSCVAVCEIIDDPSSVKCQEKNADSESSSQQPASPGVRNRAKVANSLGGEVPEKYYVVRNNDSLRVKYLLIYAEKPQPPRAGSSWLLQHKFPLLVLFYALILTLIGFCNSRLAARLKKNLFS